MGDVTFKEGLCGFDNYLDYIVKELHNVKIAGEHI
jgi:hypothetical protein